MKIKLVEGATTFEAAKNTIKQIDVNDFECQNLIVVPDAFSMQAEELVFSCLDIKSAFNIQVVGISRLASILLGDCGVMFDRVSALEEVFYIYNAVKTCEKNFVYFKNCDVEFCSKILQVIKQFKACKVKPTDIKSVGSDALDGKMHDLKLIYAEYDKLLGDKLDLSKMFEKVVDNMKLDANLAKTRLFFANFDAFTLEIGEFVCKLAECVDAVYVGMAKPLSESNAYIFENDIYNKVKTISARYGVNVPTINMPTSLAKDNLTMAKNLFAFKVEPGESKFFVNVLAKSVQEEVDYVARHIKNRIYHGAMLKDFAVALPDENYYQEVKAVFAKYGLVFYSDDATNLSQTILGRFLLKLIEIAKLGFDKEKLKYVISHPLVQKDGYKQVLEEIDFYLVGNADEFLKRFSDYKSIINLTKSLAECKKLKDFADVIEQIVGLVAENYIKIISEIETDKLYKIASENEQTLELISQVFEKLVALGGEKEFSLTDFESLLDFSMQSVKVESVPSYIDAIFVGDATKSYFQDVDTLYVLGANDLPKSRNDVGIIDDDDIKKLRLNFALEPEIKVLNRRARLKLFECLMHAQKRLIALSPPVDDKQTASYLLDLRVMFGGMVVNATSTQVFDDPTLSPEQKFERLLFSLGDKNCLVEKFSALKAKKCLPIQYESVLSTLVKEIRQDERFENLSRGAMAKIKRKSYSASPLETYFGCPFKFLIQNELKIKEKETIEPDKRNFGSFEHELLQAFVSKGKVSNFTKEQVDEFLKENLIPIAKIHYNEEFLKRKHFLNYLRKESKIILNNVVYEAKFSAFVPTCFEEKVNAAFENGTNFFGVVDRVDVSGDYFRVLDYKTGSQDGVKKNLFYGKKLQLFLYAKVMQEKLKLNCAGVYYFDCQTKYAKKGARTTLLKGLTAKNEDVVNLSDTKLSSGARQSDIINVRLKAKTKNGEFPYSSNYFVNDFSKLFDYAQKVSENAVKEIESGFIEPKPLSGECAFCKYNAICKHKVADGFREMGAARDIFKDV